MNLPPELPSIFPTPEAPPATLVEPLERQASLGRRVINRLMKFGSGSVSPPPRAQNRPQTQITLSDWIPGWPSSPNIRMRTLSLSPDSETELDAVAYMDAFTAPQYHTAIEILPPHPPPLVLPPCLAEMAAREEATVKAQLQLQPGAGGLSTLQLQAPQPLEADLEIEDIGAAPSSVFYSNPLSVDLSFHTASSDSAFSTPRPVSSVPGSISPAPVVRVFSVTERSPLPPLRRGPSKLLESRRMSTSKY